MRTWEDELPPNFPTERVIRRAQEEGAARGRRRRNRQRMLVGASLGLLLAVAAVAATAVRDDGGGRQLTAGPPPHPPVAIRAANGKIAFVRISNPEDASAEIYTMNADGSELTLLKEVVTASDLQWSPDGSKLAFSDNFDIFVLNGDGSDLRRLTTDGDGYTSNQGPTWSPDGASIAYRSLRSDGGGIWVMNVDGSGQRPLESARGLMDMWPAWSPDGSRIAYSTDTATGTDIAVTNVQTGKQEVVLEIDGFEDGVAWSPDGTQLAFRHNNDLFVANADGSGARPVATPPHTRIDKPPLSGTPGSPTWSPDGTKIAYDLSASGDACSIWVMNPDGTGQTQLTDRQQCDFGPTWQPVPLR